MSVAFIGHPPCDPRVSDAVSLLSSSLHQTWDASQMPQRRASFARVLWRQPPRAFGSLSDTLTSHGPQRRRRLGPKRDSDAATVQAGLLGGWTCTLASGSDPSKDCCEKIESRAARRDGKTSTEDSDRDHVDPTQEGHARQHPDRGAARLRRRGREGAEGSAPRPQLDAELNKEAHSAGTGASRAVEGNVT